MMQTDAEKNGRWNYRQTLALVRTILAKRGVLPPLVRVWHDKGTNVRIGLARAGKKIVLGTGATFQKAFENVFVRPMESMLEADVALDPARSTIDPARSLTE